MIDDATRECLALVADKSISGARVVRELDRIVARRDRPGGIVPHNGTELTSNAIQTWAHRHTVAWHYTAERLHEIFNGRPCDALLFEFSGDTTTANGVPAAHSAGTTSLR